MLEDAIRALLRSSENLKAVLETVIVRPSYEGSEPTTGVDNAKEKADVSGKRILAVVAHRDDRSGSEEGSVFVCTIRPTENDWSQELEIQHVLPITDDFSTTMAQTRSNTINLAPRSPAEQKTGFSLTIKPGQSSNLDFEHEPMTFRTSSVKELRVLLKECKGFKKIYDDPENITTLRSEARFHWLLPYISKRELPQTFGLVPQDLRLANQPLHTQLSPAAAGSPGDDVADYKLIRDEWIRIRARETSRRARRRLKVRLGTFNVNGKFPSQDLSGWIRSSVPASDVTVNISLPKETSSSSLGEITINPLGAHNAPINALSTGDNISGDSVPLSSPAPTDGQGVDELEYVDSDPDPDILALGFQELDLSTEALIYSTGTAREDAWCLAIFAALGEKGALYEKLSSKQLVGMLLVVIVKKALLPCFTSVDTTAAGAGIMGVMGNKGGTAVRIEFTPSACGASDISSPGSTILTFVNAHLAAFDEMFEKRNSDFQDLSKRMKFASEVLDVTGLTPLPITVYESDVLFWMGDLNYRIDLSDDDVRHVLSADMWEERFETLLRYDQLKKAIRNGKAFIGFSEYPITHLPTYRFNHSLLMDDLGYDIKRKPAWTDRILHMVAPTANVQQLSYTSHPHITMSDHRPVAADFVVDLNLYDKESHIANARKLYKIVDGVDLSERTIIKFDRTSVDMGKVTYGRAISRTIQLQNIGKVPCAYRFVPLDLSSDIHPEWLRIEPMQAMLLPDEVAYITLTAYVDNKSASKLNLGARDLDTTLILHMMMGKDHFITVTGQYQYTCFANRLSRLVRLRSPVRSLASPDDLRPEDHPINAPREVMRLVNWMMSERANTDGMFILPANESTIDTIRECLDTGDDFPFSPEDASPGVALAFAMTLLRFLDSLIDPVVPASLHSRCVQMTSRDEAFELLDTFPLASVNVWISVTAFLHFICQSSSTNQPSEKALRIATIFAPVFLRDEVDSPFPAVSPVGKRDFLLYFIS